LPASDHPISEKIGMEEIVALRPFVPAKDFAESKRFYQALDFRITLEDDQVAILKYGSFSFLLTKFYNPVLAENFMMQLMVRNVAAWWQRIHDAELPAKFGVKPPIAPAPQPWGMTVGFLFDPSGVLWHIAETIF
jgi:catechol 2,3-dioxygenase-like lactoylglutathione lyase family enzyme